MRVFIERTQDGYKIVQADFSSGQPVLSFVRNSADTADIVFESIGQAADFLDGAQDKVNLDFAYSQGSQFYKDGVDAF